VEPIFACVAGCVIDCFCCMSEHPVTMERAFAFGFKVGFGFFLAQLIAGGVLWRLWYFFTH